MKKHLYLLLLALFATIGAKAELFTPSPYPLQNSSKDVVITFTADNSTDGKKFANITADLYAHIGVYTTESPSTWKNAPAWGTNTSKYLFKYQGNKTWKLTIGDLRQYFNITDPNEIITKVCIIARNSASNTQTADNFIDVLGDGFGAILNHDAEATVITAATDINFTLATTEAATLNIAITKDGSQVSSKDAANAKSLTLGYNFASKGAYVVTATANNGKETITKTINILYMSASPAATYPGGVPKMGPVAQSNGDVIFCLAAPQKSSVLLVPSWDDYQTLDKNVMSYQDYNGYRYFWIKVSGLDPDKQYPYYFIVDGNIKVGDPYAKLVLDCHSDKWLPDNVYPTRPRYPYDKMDGTMLAVYHGNQDNYNWKVQSFDIPDPSKLIIYEMLFRDFTGDGEDNSEEGKQLGTIRGAIDKFQYFLDLGVNAIELMPVMEFNGNNSWGYNTNFYMALDKAYGSPDDLKEFIDLCHQHDIAVLLDIVFNQSDGLHPWYQMYSASANPFYNATAPHNWSVLNDWKQENPLVQQQWKDAIEYWMTKYKVDGFRFDLVKGLGSGSTSSEYGSTDGYNAKRIANMKKIHTYITAVNPKGIHINEFLGDTNEEIEYGQDGQYNWNNQNRLSAMYAIGQPGQAQRLGFYSSSACGRYGRSCISYAESHDEERLGYCQLTSTFNGTTNQMAKASLSDRMSRLGVVAVNLLMTKDATPMIWQFGELGADQTTKDSSGGNDTSPKKVVWDYYDDPSRKALFDTYSKMIGIRRANPELFSDDAATFTYSSNSANISGAYWVRIKNGAKDVIAFINASPTAAGNVTLRADMTSDYKLVTASEGFSPSIPAGTGTRRITIPANGYAVFQSPSTADIDNIYNDGFASDINVYGGEGCVIVEGAYDSLRIYDLQGRSCANSDLSEGVYIVKVDGNTTKVMVR
ncbi:MAG: hypothetical protein C7K11_02750 [Candidatus Amulumruptor caecigallinarius]|nr:MAG: hypothetical protein C7K11_02750 [Candidatus Amulumruptor caecigallinarius]